MLDRHDLTRVLCGHCNRARSAGPCGGCGRQVCQSCLDDFGSCTEPRSFEYRLGLGARLRIIATGGALGVVSTLTRRTWLLDVLGRRRLESTGLWWTGQCRAGGDLSSRGELLWPRISSVQYTGKLRISSVSLSGDIVWLGVAAASVRFDRSETALVAATVDERVLVHPLDGKPEVFAPLARRVIQSFDADVEAGLVAAASFGEVGVVRLADDRRIVLSSLEREDSRWLGIAGQRIAVIFGLDRYLPQHRLVVAELDGSELTPIYSAHHRGGQLVLPAVADLSDDGRYVAVALSNKEVAVHDLEAGGVQRLGGHTDKIAAIRFGPGGRFLVSSDFDNRVIVRFRDGDSFVERLESLDLVEDR